MKTTCLGFFILLAFISRSQTSGTFIVHFDFNKSALTENAIQQLDSFLQMGKPAVKSVKIELHGHCDSIGSDSYNLGLSNRRVITIKDYLISAGVPPKNIVHTVGHGKRTPLNENKTEEDRQLNRRVEIKVSLSDVIINEVSLKEKIADSSTIAGTNIVLRNINYHGGMHRFLQESQPMLNELLDAMRTYPLLVIRIEGHICCEPGNIDGVDAETGIRNLSEARAKELMDYLVVNGITADRITYKGFGHSAPIFPYPEKSEEERVANRRVEIKIIRK